jgi:hypothetical protein
MGSWGIVLIQTAAGWRGGAARVTGPVRGLVTLLFRPWSYWRSWARMGREEAAGLSSVGY